MDRPLRIAVADDELDIRDYFRKVLPRLGHAVVAVARDRRELIEQCRAACPDLVIRDVCIPELDGVEAAEAVCRERPTPFILMSAHLGPLRLRCAAAEHVPGHLGKPIRQAELLPLLDLARQRRARPVAVDGAAREAEGAAQGEEGIGFATPVGVRST